MNSAEAWLAGVNVVCNTAQVLGLAYIAAVVSSRRSWRNGS